MDKASKDVLFTIATDLDLPDLLRWCQTERRIQKYVCNNTNVWRSKLLKDYPDYERFKLNKSLKETYVFMYQLSLIKKLLNTKESLYDIFLRKSIDLYNKSVEKVPAFDLPYVVILYLSYNNLTQIPAFRLPMLQRLYLNNNQLTKLPAFDLPNLEQLYLSYNNLTQIPAFRLPNLQQLYLSNNQLTELPAFDLPNLEVIDLEDNQLAGVPTFRLQNLQRIYLKNNRLTEEERKRTVEKYGNELGTY